MALWAEIGRGTIRSDHVVAPDAGRDSRESGVHGLVRRIVTVEAIHAELLHVDRVREVDRLNGRMVLRRGGAAVGGKHGGADGQGEESWYGGPLPSLGHRDGVMCSTLRVLVNKFTSARSRNLKPQGITRK